jgi:hypothetical protein
VTQSWAILMYLCEKTGKFLPADPVGRMRCFSGWPKAPPAMRRPITTFSFSATADVGRKQAETDRIAAVDAVDHGRRFLAPVVVGREEIRLMPARGNQVEQHDADTERLVTWHALPKLVETTEQKAGVARLIETDLIPGCVRP